MFLQEDCLVQGLRFRSALKSKYDLRNPKLVPHCYTWEHRWFRPAWTDPLCLESPFKYQKGPTLVIEHS